jgi:hypothetical protein
MTARRLTKAGAAYERTTSFHEAAHACAAIALRIPFAKVIINVGQALPGGRMCYDKAHLKFWRLLQDGHRKDPAVIGLCASKISCGLCRRGRAATLRTIVELVR